MVLQSSGFVKPSRFGQIVRVVVREKKRGRLIGRRVMRFRTHGKSWQPFPHMAYRTSGRRGARINLCVASGRRRDGRLLVDGVRLARDVS
jgi:hypothetical protein